MTQPSMTTDAPPPPEAERPRGVTVRAVVLGTLLVPINAFWVLRMEEVMFGPYPSLLSLFANVVFLLFLLVGLNALLRRLQPRFAFNQGELLTLYTMLTISTGMAGQSGLNVVCSLIGHGAWFDTPEKGWGQFASAFPDWLVIRDRDILRGHYLGNASFYRPEILRAWMVPIFAWTLLFSLLLLVAYGTNILVRRQWADRERLTFPIIWLPMEMTEGGVGRPFFRNRLMWVGFALAGGLNLWNGLAFLYPSLPMLPIGIIDLKPYLTIKPWNAIDWTPITLYPLVIGLGYLLPLDLLFSCGFFFLFWKSQLIVSNAMAWDTMKDFPFIREQGFGSVIGLFLYYLWSGRTHYREIWRRARSSVRERDAPEEGLSERAALILIAVAAFGLLCFGLAARVTWWVIILFFALYIATLVVVTRIRAELGAPIHDFTFMGPDTMLTRALGTGSFRQTDLAFFSWCYPLTYSRSNDPMPIALESQQMARLRRMEVSRLFGVILFTTLLGTLSTFWAYEHQAYQLGTSAKWYAGTHFGQEGYEKMAAWSGGGLNPRPNPTGTLALGVGLLTTLGLLALRLRFFGFPLHPIGYAVSSAWAINIVWLPLFIAWVCKGLVMRYGGLRVYRLLLPFFLGLILGDCVLGSMWGLLSLLLNMRTYNFFGA
jgi:hypothetical protein